MLIKQKSLSLPRNLVLWTFAKLLTVFSTKINLLYFLYSSAQRCSGSDKSNLFAENFCKNFDFGVWVISLPVLLSSTILKLNNTSVTSKMVKKVITNLDLSNASGPDCFFFLIGIHSMQGWTATTRHGVTRKETQKGLQDTENLFRKNLELKDVC